MPCQYSLSSPMIKSYLQDTINLTYLRDLTPVQLNELYDLCTWLPAPAAPGSEQEHKDKKNLLAWILRAMPHLKHPSLNMPTKALLDGSVALRGAEVAPVVSSGSSVASAQPGIKQEIFPAKPRIKQEDFAPQQSALEQMRPSFVEKIDMGQQAQPAARMQTRSLGDINSNRMQKLKQPLSFLAEAPIMDAVEKHQRQQVEKKSAGKKPEFDVFSDIDTYDVNWPPSPSNSSASSTSYQANRLSSPSPFETSPTSHYRSSRDLLTGPATNNRGPNLNQGGDVLTDPNADSNNFTPYDHSATTSSLYAFLASTLTTPLSHIVAACEAGQLDEAVMLSAEVIGVIARFRDMALEVGGKGKEGGEGEGEDLMR